MRSIYIPSFFHPLGISTGSTHITHMANIFDILKSTNKKLEECAPGKKMNPDTGTQTVQEPGSDARRTAERKAEEAGRKWREKAEADGDVPKEIGGPKGLEPTRYGDWEKAGRCVDF